MNEIYPENVENILDFEHMVIPNIVYIQHVQQSCFLSD